MMTSLGEHPYDSTHPREPFLFLHEACRDRLVKSGALVYREFVFKHIKGHTAAARGVWNAAMITFPDNVYTTSPDHGENAPLVLDVWASPKEMQEWERFVAQHDRCEE